MHARCLVVSIRNTYPPKSARCVDVRLRGEKSGLDAGTRFRCAPSVVNKSDDTRNDKKKRQTRMEAFPRFRVSLRRVQEHWRLLHCGLRSWWGVDQGPALGEHLAGVLGDWAFIEKVQGRHTRCDGKRFASAKKF